MMMSDEDTRRMREANEEILKRWAAGDRDIEEELSRTSDEKKQEIAEKLRKQEAEDNREKVVEEELETSTTIPTTRRGKLRM